MKETFASKAAAKKAVDDAIKKYNGLRIHDSCDRLSLMMAHEQRGVLKKHWKPRKYKQKFVVMRGGITTTGLSTP